MDTDPVVTETARAEPVLMFDYVLAVRGVFGRNRTSKFATYRLARVPRAEPLSEAECVKLASAKLDEIRFKSGTVYVDEDPVVIDGVFVKFLLFSGRRVAGWSK